MKLSALLIACVLFFALCGSAREVGLRYDFNDPESLNKSWEFHCSIFMVPRTSFKIENVASAADKKSLVVESKSATGVLMTDPKVDLRKYPVMRWRWRVIRPVNVPKNGPEPDDQAGVVYLGDGTMISQKSVAYRWECNTALGTKKNISYGGGMMKVRAECIRNRKTSVGEWVQRLHRWYPLVLRFHRCRGTSPQAIRPDAPRSSDLPEYDLRNSSCPTSEGCTSRRGRVSRGWDPDFEARPNCSGSPVALRNSTA